MRDGDQHAVTLKLGRQAGTEVPPEAASCQGQDPAGKPLRGRAADTGVQLGVLTLTFLEAWDQFVNNILHGPVMTGKRNRTAESARNVNAVIRTVFM